MKQEPQITKEGVRQLAIAFEDARDGILTRQCILTVLASNLGLAQVNYKLDKVHFNPLEHEDITGGAIPGDLLHVIYSGWKLGNELVIKTKVSNKFWAQ